MIEFWHWIAKRWPSEKSVLRWVAAIERHYGVSQKLGDCATCEETGEEYVEVLWSNGHYIVEHKITKAERHATPGRAWSRWMDAFQLYHESKGGKIHWRIRPEMTHVVDQAEFYPQRDLGYCVYSRLFAEKT